MKDKSRQVLLELYMGIGFSFAFFAVLGIFTMRPYISFLLGLVAGVGVAALCVWWLYDDLDAALDMTEKHAKGFMTLHSIARLLSRLAVMAVAYILGGWPPFVGAAVGILSTKIGAYLHPFISKKITRTYTPPDLTFVPDEDDEEDESAVAQDDGRLLETTSAGGVSLNATKVDLYGLDGSALEKLGSVPSSKRTSFQIKVTGGQNPSYWVSEGDSVTVTDKGLVKPNYVTWYSAGSSGSYSAWSTFKPEDMTGVMTQTELQTGKSTVTVYTDSGTATIEFNVLDYGMEYMEEALDEYIRQNVTAGMSVYDKVVLACRYVVQYPYSTEASSAYGMFYTGGGDCWASTDMVIKLCEHMGLKAWSRNGNRDAGAGSGHMNAMVDAGDGTYYEVEAGYSGTETPRPYTISKRTTLWTYTYDENDGVTLIQYDGAEWPKSLSIPSTIEGHPVTTLGYSCLIGGGFKAVSIPASVTRIEPFAFSGCESLESLTIGAQVTSIGDSAFVQCPSLKLSVSQQNPYYSVRGNALYDKGQTTLLSAQNVSSIEIPNTVRTIGMGAFYYNYNIQKVIIPPTVTKIENYAFEATSLSDLWIDASRAPEVVEYGLGDNYDAMTIHVPLGAKGYDVEPWSSFTVVGPRVSDATVTLGQTTYTYDGGAKKPAVTVKHRQTTLRAGTDFDVVYAGNVNAGQASVTVKGKNGYTGSKTVKFSIARASVAVPKATNRTYNGKAQVGVAAGAGYKLSGTAKATAAGTYTAKATPDANHRWPDGTTGAKALTWKVGKAASSVKLAAQTRTYTGKALAYTGKVARSGSAGKVTYRYFSDAKCAKAVKAANVKAAKTYYVRATLAADANHKAATSAAAKLVVAKARNPIAATAVARTAKLATVKKKAVTVARPMSVSKAQGKLAYAKVAKGSAKCLTVNKSTGKVAVKRGTKKGTYKIKIKVTAAGNANYKAGSKTVVCKVTVK